MPSTAESSPPSPRFDALLLDFDGTVLDTIDLILASFRFTMGEHLDQVPPDSVWLAGMGTPLIVQLRALSTDEAQAQAMRNSYLAHQVAHHDDLARTFDGMQACLDAVHGRLPLALVTSKARAGVDRSFRAFGLAPYFDVLVTADDVERPKPAPEPVQRAARALGVQTDRCLMVGDSPHDIASGRAAGATTAAAGWGAFDPPALRAANPDHWLDQPADLTALVLGSPR